jgi:putative ABC transport system permease protein
VILRLFFLKELKKSYYFFLGLSLLILIGSVGLLGISFISEKIKTNLNSNARELLTSDLSISARRDLFEIEKNKVNDFFKNVNHSSYQVIDIYSMLSNPKRGDSKLVEIRCYEEGYPFYGLLKLEQGLFQGKGLYVSRDLSNLWNVRKGDLLKVGSDLFTVLGIVENDTSIGVRGVSLAPRVYLPLDLVKKAGLLNPGSTGQFSLHFKIDSSDNELKDIRQKILGLIPDPAIKVMTAKESSSQAGRIFDYITDFMSLSALVGFLLSLVGIFYFYQSYLVTRLKDFCLFYLHGMTKKQIVLGVSVQFSIIFLSSMLLFVIIINPLYFYFRDWLGSSLGLELPLVIDYSSLLIQFPLLYGLALSVLIPLLMGLIRTPLGIQIKSSKQALGEFRFFDFIPFLIYLWGVACYLSHSLKIGSYFLLSLIIIIVLSLLLIKFFQFFTLRLRSKSSLIFLNVNVGIALRNFIQSGQKMSLSFISIVMGVSLISLIYQLDFLIKREFTLDSNKPSLFLFDIQEEQLENLRTLARDMKVELSALTPLVRGRIEKINGAKFERVEERSQDISREEEFEARTKNRGINLTFRQDLSPSEKIIKGEPFPEVLENQQDIAFLSIEEKFAKRMKISIGDKIIFDIHGLQIEGIVRNFREVKWTSFYPNFFVNISPGFIDEAPKTFLAVVPKDYSSQKVAFQKASVDKFPNISFIDMDQLIKKLSDLFEKSRRAIELISWLSLSIGFVILYGLAHDQIHRRSYDISLLKSLGFSPSSLLIQLLAEFGFIFVSATSLGLFLGWSMGQLIGLEVFKIGYEFHFYHYLSLFIFLNTLCFATIIFVSQKAIRGNVRHLLSDN